MLATETTGLVIIDVQGKLAQLMDSADTLFNNLQTMVRGAKAIGVPIFWAEQIPNKLGPTIDEVAQHLEGVEPFAKSCFSCWRQPEFQHALTASGCKQLLVVGIEAHICVTQSTLDFLREGYEVHLVSDAIGARNPANKAIALQRCADAGATISCTEMALFELMRDASHPQFKAIQQLIK